jgi:hypothetical protein
MRSNVVRRLIQSSVAVVALVLLTVAAAPGPRIDFSSAQVGKLPAHVQAVVGGYAVAEFEKDKVLELPGEPLDIFGLLFGPGEQTEVDVRARAWSASSGRRFPEFGVGTGDVAGYRLLLLPGQKKLELRKSDDPIKSVAVSEPWKSGTWTWLRLRVMKKAEGRWSVEGKVWPADGAEPAAWQLTHEVSDPPQAGRASVWGIPFAGTPIRFDDLSATPPAR